MDAQNYLYKLKEERTRRKRFAFFATLGVIVVLLVVGIAWVFLRTPIFSVRKITFEGGDKITKDDVLAFVRAREFPHSFFTSLLGADNMIVWPNSVATSNLAFLPLAKDVVIKKNYFTRTITLSVMERTPYGVWCKRVVTSGDTSTSSIERVSENGRTCFWFDEDGFIFKRSVGIEGGSLIHMVSDYSGQKLGFGSRVLPNTLLPNLFSVLRVIDASNLNPEEIRINDLSLQELEVRTYDGPRIYFSLRFPADQTLPVLGSLTTRSDFKNLYSIDFRVENRAYYK